jgi:hypothetical protein
MARELLIPQMLKRGGGARALTYLLNEEFTDAQAAPLTSPRTCVPGPGQIGFVDTVGADAIISGGKYVRPHPSTGQAFNGYGLYSLTSFAREPGLTFYAKVRTSTIDRVQAVGFHTSAALAQTPGVIFNNTASLQIADTTGVMEAGGSLTNGVDYQVAVIMRPFGALYLIRGGTQYPDWTLLGVLSKLAEPTVYLNGYNYNGTIDVDQVAVVRKTGALATAYGKATAFDPVPTAGDATIGSADGHQYFTWTPQAAETLSLYFRRTDDNNCYRLDCNQAAGTIRLYRRVAGVDTELDAGKTQTWTAGQQYRIGIMFAGGSIRTFVEQWAVATASKHAVSGETAFLTNTGAKVTGFTRGANWEHWPRTFSGTDLETLA